MDMENNTTDNTTTNETGDEILVIASKLKNYIRTKSGMNTSAAVIATLSGKVRELCDAAIERAKADGRKTLMDRDFNTNNS
jgi:histone H3/H4